MLLTEILRNVSVKYTELQVFHLGFHFLLYFFLLFMSLLFLLLLLLLLLSLLLLSLLILLLLLLSFCYINLFAIISLSSPFWCYLHMLQNTKIILLHTYAILRQL